MAVTWRIEPIPEGCRITIEHDFRPRVGPWAVIVDRLFTRPIAGRTLATFKALAEAVGTPAAAGLPAAGEESADPVLADPPV